MTSRCPNPIVELVRSKVGKVPVLPEVVRERVEVIEDGADRAFAAAEARDDTAVCTQIGEPKKTRENVKETGLTSAHAEKHSKAR
jgi:hypothetical protein